MCKICVSLGVDKKFLCSMKEKLCKTKNSEVLIDSLELMYWVLEKMENGMTIVAIDEQSGKPMEKFTTHGLNCYKQKLDNTSVRLK